MSKETTVMTKSKNELSTLTVEKILGSRNFPDDFDKLSAKKQKEVIAGVMLKIYKQAIDCMNYDRKAKDAARKLMVEIKLGPAAMKLHALKKDMKRNNQMIIALLERFNGMKELVVALGFNEKMFSQMKFIEED